MLTFILTLYLLKADGAVTTSSVSEFKPFLTLESCQQAGERWLLEQVGNNSTYTAHWACKKESK